VWKRGKTKIDIEMTRTKEEGGKEMGSEDKKGDKGRSLKLAYFSSDSIRKRFGFTF
jgi:hypothetical protein